MTVSGRDNLKAIVLTGGPGGGKTALLERISQDSTLCGRVVVAEEAIHGMRFVRLNPRSREFQCALVAIQAATEESLRGALAGTDKRIIISHRGSLDPCAFWQSFGNSRESFFEMTGTTLEDHHKRYDLVIHMESAAVRMPDAYVRYPAAHRPESIAQAAQLDGYLGELWRDHPNYIKIEGTPNIEEKLSQAISAIRELVVL